MTKTSESSDWLGELSRDDVIQWLRDHGWPIPRLVAEIQKHLPPTLVNSPIVGEAAEAILVNLASVPSFFQQSQVSGSRLLDHYLKPAVNDRLNKFCLDVAEHVASVTSNFPHLQSHQEDITQNILLAFLGAGMKPYDPSRNGGSHAAFHGWVHQIARYSAIKYNDRLGREKARNGVEVLSESPNRPTIQQPKPDRAEAILAEVEDHLTEKEQQLYRLLYIEGKTPEEAADVLRITKEACYKRKQRLALRISTLLLWDDQFPDDGPFPDEESKTP